MLHKSKILFMLPILLVLTSCSTDSDSSLYEDVDQFLELVEQGEEDTSQENDDEIEEESEVEEDQEEVASSDNDEEAEEEPEAVEANQANSEFEWLYDELSGKAFLFSSGVGAWRTYFKLTDNGEFSGVYSDADGSEMVVSEFDGQFDITEEYDEFTYRMDLVSLIVTSETGKVEHDGERTITYVEEPHGFPSGSDTFELYLPYKPKSDVSDQYLSWVYEQSNNGRDFLNSFGIYNVDAGFGMEEFFE